LARHWAQPLVQFPAAAREQRSAPPLVRAQVPVLKQFEKENRFEWIPRRGWISAWKHHLK